jgi:ABC-type nitrate/sulfonate/bicarbonate transport system permease component
MLYVVFQFSLSLNGIVAMMVVIGVLAYAFDASVALAGKRLIPWRSEKGGTL